MGYTSPRIPWYSTMKTFLAFLALIVGHANLLRCFSCKNNPECSNGHYPGRLVSCAEKEGDFAFCYVYLTTPTEPGVRPEFIKGCLEYGDDSDPMAAAWPRTQKCIKDGQGIPSGHGCKCLGEECNHDICSAANTHDPPTSNMTSSEGTFMTNGDTTDDDECRTINCQKCIFPFKYQGVEYNKCTTVDSENLAPWCAVDIQEDGEATYGAWEDCDPSCPVSNPNAGVDVEAFRYLLYIVTTLLFITNKIFIS